MERIGSNGRETWLCFEDIRVECDDTVRMGLKQTEKKGVHWSHLSQDRDK